MVGAFTFVYIFIPNTRVKLRYAFIGGLISGISRQAGSMLFASFVAGSAKYAAIYPSFAIGIILLIWIYPNRMILLLGPVWPITCRIRPPWPSVRKCASHRSCRRKWRWH